VGVSTGVPIPEVFYWSRPYPFPQNGLRCAHKWRDTISSMVDLDPLSDLMTEMLDGLTVTLNVKYVTMSSRNPISVSSCSVSMYEQESGECGGERWVIVYDSSKLARPQTRSSLTAP
jgi:hypothetical protein